VDELSYIPMKNILFTYGTLEAPVVMQYVTGQDFRNEPALLKDYVRYKLTAASYPGITQKEGSEVEGTVYFDIDEAALYKLDVYEDTCYQRQTVEVILTDNQVIQAMAYIITDNKKDLLSTIKWDKQKFIDEELQQFMRSMSVKP
jgi:gamma-glutamylcyclotransferase (GGCT)/AIG2-like uncharacterized protein YtfP